MSQTLSRMATLAAALAAVVALPAAAQQTSAAQPAADAQTVVRDADTGKLRAPTAEEHEHMRRSHDASTRNARVAPGAMAPRAHHSGARGTRLHDELMHHSVMVRNADGTSSMVCVDSNGVEHALHTLQPQNTTPAAIPRATAKLETE